MDLDLFVRWGLHISLALAIVIVAVCRLDLMDSGFRFDYRFTYLAVALAALWALLMWLYDPEPARWPGIFIMAAQLLLLTTSGPRWRSGPPPESRK